MRSRWWPRSLRLTGSRRRKTRVAPRRASRDIRHRRVEVAEVALRVAQDDVKCAGAGALEGETPPSRREPIASNRYARLSKTFHASFEIGRIFERQNLRRRSIEKFGVDPQRLPPCRPGLGYPPEMAVT